MTAPMSDAEKVVAELRDRSTRINGLPLNTEAADLYRRAADLIARQAARLEENRAIYDEQVGRAENQWKAWEARATAAEAEKERLAKLSDRYGVALMMIRAGCSDPQRFAGNILDDKKPVDIDLED